MKRGNVLITGGTSGLGLALVRHCLSSGWHVWATGRTLTDRINEEKDFHFLKVDFTDLRLVAGTIKSLLAKDIKFDLIINNAGILSPPSFTLTTDNLEYTFQVNFLSHLLINELIAGHDNNPITIVSVTSPVYRHAKPSFKIPDSRGYKPLKAYSESKFYLLLLGGWLTERYPEKSIRYAVFDPGTFSSSIHRMQRRWFRNMYRIASPFMRHPSKVGKSLMRKPEDEGVINGEVYSRRKACKFRNDSDPVAVNLFLKECQLKIEEYLH